MSSDIDLILRWLLKILPEEGGIGPILTVVLMKAMAWLTCWMRSDPEVPDIPSDDPGQAKGQWPASVICSSKVEFQGRDG